MKVLSELDRNALYREIDGLIKGIVSATLKDKNYLQSIDYSSDVGNVIAFAVDWENYPEAYPINFLKEDNKNIREKVIGIAHGNPYTVVDRLTKLESKLDKIEVSIHVKGN